MDRYRCGWPVLESRPEPEPRQGTGVGARGYLHDRKAAVRMTAKLQRETGWAKVNLALHVRERLANGYHRIETLFAFVADGDVLSAEPADELSLTVGGPFAAQLTAQLEASEDNLILRAAQALRKELGLAGVTYGARLTLEKNLPVAAGLGGGSADAAAALRLLDRMWRLDYGVENLVAKLPGARLGADVSACLHSRTMLGKGIGDQLFFVGGESDAESDAESAKVSNLPILLVNPGRACPTSSVFRGWDGVNRGPLTLSRWLAGRWDEGRNDLTASAIALVPEIAALLDVLNQQKAARLVRMSGSGATCFALFDTPEERDLAKQNILKKLPRAWTLASHVR